MAAILLTAPQPITLTTDIATSIYIPLDDSIEPGIVDIHEKTDKGKRSDRTAIAGLANGESLLIFRP
jgi:hypothetical protein